MKSLRIRTFLIIYGYLSIFIILPLVSSCLLKGFTHPLKILDHSEYGQSQVNNHNPIFVNGDLEFDSEIWSGSGTESDPFLINGLIIDQSDKAGNLPNLIHIQFTNAHVHINNCILIGGYYGIYLFISHNVKISNTRVINNAHTGIYVEWSQNTTIENNDIIGNGFCGIKFAESVNNTVQNNDITNNKEYGFWLISSPNNTIEYNRFWNNDLYLSGYSKSKCFQKQVVSNLANDNPLIFLQNSNNIVAPPNIGQIVLINCTSIEVVNQGFNNVFFGVLIAFCENITIHNSNIIGPTNTMIIDNSNNITVQHNNISKSISFGIRSFGLSDNFTITDNRIFNNAEDGMLIVDLNSSLISNNHIFNNSKDGISFTSLENSFIYDNIIEKNFIHGLFFGSSTNNSLVNNTVFDNYNNGIIFQDSPNNSIIDNNLTNDEFVYISNYFQNCLQKTVTNNFVNGKPFLFWVNIISSTVPQNIGQIVLVNCSKMQVIELKMKAGTIGLQALFSSNFTIHNNSICVSLIHTDNATISNNKVNGISQNGINLEFVSNITVLNNTIWSNKNGIRLKSSTNNIVSNNSINCSYIDYISYPKYGISLESSTKNSIINNTIYDSSVAINLESSRNNLIEENSLSKSDIAIYFFISGNNTIIRNEIEDCGFQFDHSNDVDEYLQFQVENNTINGKTLIFWQSIVDSMIISQSAGQIVLINCTRIDIQELNIEQCTVGIHIAHSSNITVLNNSLRRNTVGIDLHFSVNTTISNNVFNNSHNGCQLYYSSNIIINNNSILFAFEYGILLQGSDNNTISFNILFSSVNYAIVFDSLCSFNAISYNDFISTSDFNLSSQASDDGLNNGFIYNHWSDWRSPDLNNDGIVDIPYLIDGYNDNTDPYPLTDPIRYVYPDNDPEIDPILENDPADILSIQDIINIVFLLSLCALLIGGSFLFFSKHNKNRLNAGISPHLSFRVNSSYPNDSGINPSLDQITSSSNPNMKLSGASTPGQKIDRSITLKTYVISIISSIVWFIAYSTLYPIKKRVLTRKEVLSNPTRNKILLILQENEFEHFNYLKYQLNCGNSILAWHLQVLIDFKLVIERNIGQFKLYYLVNKPVDENKLLLYTTIRSDIALSIVQAILFMKDEQYTTKKIIQKTNFSHKIIGYYFRKLVKLGIIKYDKKSRLFSFVKGQRKYLSWIVEKYHSSRFILSP